MDGGSGNDTIYGGSEGDLLIAGSGADRIFGESGSDWIVLGVDDCECEDDEGDGVRDTVYGTVAQLSGDTIQGFVTGKDVDSDVIVVTGLPSGQGKYLDSIVLTGNVLSLSKVGGGTIHLDGLTGTMHTDTVLGSDGGILIYVV